MSAADPTATFLAALRASGLLPPDRLADLAAWANVTRPDVQGLAKEAHRRGGLTPFQIKEVFKGRGADLTLGPYVFLDLLGEGGMGRVYKARHTRLGRDEAVKVIRKEKLAHPAAEGRFYAEIQAVSKMDHPNVVAAYDAGQVGDTHYYAMELIDGTDLTRVVRERGALPVPEACEYVRQAALGLHHAHEMGLVHRDVKPSNLIVTRNGRQVKVVDLGLARVEQSNEDAHRITQEGFVIGTPDFLAPEQARDPGGVDIRADVYALGATLYYLLTAKVPYDGASPTEKLLKHCTEPPPELLAARPDAPPPLADLLRWFMAKRADDRPQTPAVMAAALQPFCPRPVPGSGGYAPVPQHRPPAWPAHPAAAPVLLPVPLPLPGDDPAPSSQLFKLPPDAGPGPSRRLVEARRKSLVGPVGFGLAGLLVVGVFGYAAYRVFHKGEPPVEPAVTAGVGLKLVRIDGGTFRMGSDPDAGPPNERPAHEVTVRGPFYMAATEVTQRQFQSVMETNPSAMRGKEALDRPVETVSWDAAADFCRKLTDKERGEKYFRDGWAYRLPTEAEWEYACRAGTTTPFAFGDKLQVGKQAVFKFPGPDEPEGDNPWRGGADRPAPPAGPDRAGKADANPWGLHDMPGNVAEWCGDWYDRPYPGDGPRDNPTGPPSGDRRVVRGGSWESPMADCRSAFRAGLVPSAKSPTVGFRVVYAPVK